jgi:hypothetical protein
MYHQNHKQRAVLESAVNLDDLISAGAKPGGIIRVKQPNAIQELGGNFFSGEALQLLNYADTQKDQRVGVSPNGAGMSSLESNDSAHGVERIMSAREMLVQMMIRSWRRPDSSPRTRWCVTCWSDTRQAQRRGSFAASG